MKMHFEDVLLLGVITASLLVAQNAPAKKKTAVATSNYLEVAITYDALNPSASSGKGFWLQGGGIQAEGHFSHRLGVVADLAGEHTGNMHGSGVGLDMATMTFGPRFAWQPARYRRTALYGQALVGQGKGFNNAFPDASGAASSANGLALKVGGSVNYTLSRGFAMRAIEADWLRT
jgi:hypothetical protein